MKGHIVGDWSKVDLSNPEHTRKVLGAFQHFLALPDKDKKLKAAMRHFTTKGDFPPEILQVLEKYHELPNYDLGYEEVFDIRDFTGTSASGFDILDVASGLTFEEVPIGGKAKVHKMSGAKARVEFIRVGAALGWDRTWLEDGQYWNLEDNAMQFRNKFFQARAKSFYSLIDAVGSGQNTAWQAALNSNLANTDATYLPERDTATMNKAAEQILLDLKDSGLNVTANSNFIVLAPIQLRARITRALNWLSQSFAGAQGGLVYNFTPIWSMMLDSSSSYYVILPKGKLKGGYRQDLTLLAAEDILAYADTTAGWGRFGGAIGEVKQIRRCATA